MTGVAIAVQLELALLTPEVRGDRSRLEELLHPDFVEVGASGRRWTRSEMIDALVATSLDPSRGASAHDVTVSDMTSRALNDDTVLVTYTSRRGTAVAHRSSVWIHHRGRWVVVFHQGTPAEVPPSGAALSPP